MTKDTEAMQLSIGDIIAILSDNLGLRKSVMPIGARKATAWAKGLNIPRGGERIFYTGQMYQLMPSIGAMQHQMETVNGLLAKAPWLMKFVAMGRTVNRFVNTSWFMTLADGIMSGGKNTQAVYDRRLRNIARLLQKAGVKFGYLYENEMYAGALVCDLGGKDTFEAHARRVYASLKAAGVKSVITADPHTTDMLRDVYPKLIEGYDLEVKSYLEVLAEASMPVRKKLDRPLALHDSCVYARYVNVIDPPRTLLANAGGEVAEPEQSGKFTQCCGGPIEALYPEKAKKFAEERLAQLKTTGCKEVVAMCPICLQNLEHAAGNNGTTVRDISEYLAEAYCEAEPVL